MAKSTNARGAAPLPKLPSKTKAGKATVDQFKAGKRVASDPSPVPAKPAQKAAGGDRANAASNSKQSRLIAMLQSGAGVTVAAMMQATGWQQHSVRGFLAGVVRKKLQLKLESTIVHGDRVYRIGDAASSKSGGSRMRRGA
jgi:Protein of unknown function (DUF3489)